MIVVGLTGSIGMGKSTVAQMFKNLGYPIQDADKVVHEIMATNAEVISNIQKEFPDAVQDQNINRARLGSYVFNQPDKLKILEDILYPHLKRHRQLFLEKARQQRADLAILDIPLLFEKGLDKECDFTITVRAPDRIQKQRVLSRPGMTEEKFKNILAQQLPIREKMSRADFVIQTGLNKAYSMREVKQTIANILKQHSKSSLEKRTSFFKQNKEKEISKKTNSLKERLKR